MSGVIFTIALVAAVVIPVLGLAHALDPGAATVAGLVSEGIAAKVGYSKNFRFNHLRQWRRWIPDRLGSRHVDGNLFFVVIK